LEEKMPNSALVVLTTVVDVEQGQRIARHLVDARLAACVQLHGPIRSVYRWQGELCDEPEWQLVIKTQRACFAAVEAAIRRLHSYENPEVVALPVEAASAAYLAWLVAETTPA